ncbi:hypothetical protein BGX24_010729 [Mortierella sp. AD032]|nr:hypothetical protein BGX24_010729 [Mortierella sp. AD032]
MKDKDHTPPSDSSYQQDYNNSQQQRYPSYDHQLYDRSSHGNSANGRYHHQESSPYYHQEASRESNSVPYSYLQRGHRHSTDSAAADTLLMLSAAAFMDPDAIRMVTSTPATADEGDYRFPRFGEEQQPQLQQQQQQQQQHQHRPLMMAKTVSAPVSSAYRSPLHPLSRPFPPRPRELVEEPAYMDVDVEPSSATSSQHTLRRPSVKCNTGTQTLLTKGPGSSRHLSSPTSSRFVPPPSTLISSAIATPDLSASAPSSTATTTTLASTGNGRHVTSPVSSSAHNASLPDTNWRSGMNADPATTARPSFIINMEGASHRAKEEHEDIADRPLRQEHQEAAEREEGEVEEEEEEEDEVMSEGVVHVNSYLSPITLSPPNKIPLPLILTSALPQQQQQQQQQRQASSHGQDPPMTPTSARTPRTPKQARTPKNSRPTKRSQNETISVSNGSVPLPSSSSGGGRGGKNSTRDSNAVDYFYSPFPPSTCSPASSPSSPSSSFQAQLQQLTNKFVSIQPHASPTSRFRRTNATTTLPFSPPASPGQGQELLSSSTHSSPTKSHGGHSVRSTGGNVGGGKSNLKPKWHTQPYMMFLALRAMPNRTAPRQELIHAAVELDKKFSAEKGLPRVFTGKTPMNSASACLTNNGDKYFIPFKPEGSRSTHFRLAYQPGDFNTAVADYNGWMEELIRHDWPHCFGALKDMNVVEAAATTATAMNVGGGAGSGGIGGRPDFARMDSDSRKRGPDTDAEELEQQQQDEDLLLQLSSFTGGGGGISSKKIKSTFVSVDGEDEKEEGQIETGVSSSPSSFTLDEISSLNHIRGNFHHNISSSSKATSMGVRRLDLDLNAAGRLDEPNSCPPTPATATALELERGLKLDDSPVIANRIRKRVVEWEDMDLTRVPSSLAEVVEVKESLIPHAGHGLFAKMDLPAGTPLGFYFGVPMTENEFDSLKEGVGAASQYSIMYRRTVLDATDEQGQPFKQQQGDSGNGQVEGQVEGEELLCPFHFLNEDKDGNVSFITGSQVNQVICTTNRRVMAGSELLVFFSRESERHWPAAAPVVASGAAAAVKGVTTSDTSTDAAAAAAAVGGGEQQGQDGSGTSGSDRWSRDAGTTSPSPSGRPRRETANKPVRYSR